MNILAIVFSLVATSSAWAVCSTPIIRTSVGASSVLTSTRYNSDVNTAYNRVNNLPGDCLIDASISTSKIANGAITTSKIADGAITAAKVATGTIPEIGRLLRVKSFTTSGTWTKASDVGSVLVHVVGGGGASYFSGATNGTDSSFGGHCIGKGGTVPAGATTAGGLGGASQNGDVNLNGGSGELVFSVNNNIYMNGSPGYSMLGDYGRGGVGSTSAPSPGGGAGGYCSKIIQSEFLGSTETVTIGAGGTNPGASTTPGKSGIVIVYEYSK